MKSLQQTLYEKLKIRPSKSDINEFDVITLLEDVTNLLLKKKLATGSTGKDTGIWNVY